MNITIVAVGKLKERFWTDACAEYLKRLGGYARVTVREVPDIGSRQAKSPAEAIQKEGVAIMDALPERAHVVLLDIGGRERSSTQIATRIEQLGLQGESELAFVIGGSDGVSQEVRDRADESLSFGPITLPHNLARVVLLEQLYRAFKIIRHEPYHK